LLNAGTNEVLVELHQSFLFGVIGRICLEQVPTR
jgi:hypothetical protein